MNVGDFEDKVWEIDRIRVILRAPAGTVVRDYEKQYGAKEDYTIKEYLTKRIAPCVGDIEAVVINGSYDKVTDNMTHVSTIRDTYR